MVDKNTDFFKIEDHFKETEHIPSIPIFENRLSETPPFTIAIPTYKRANYLKQALESAINQKTEVSYEIIVIDNNPERYDETEQLMMSYSTLSNLSYFKNTENLGMIGNWNRLYSKSFTKWVIMLHDDDLLLSNFLEFHSLILAKIKHVDILFPSYYSSTSTPIISKKTFCDKIILSDFILGNPIGPPVGMIIKRKTIFQLGGFRKRLYPALDLDLYVQAVANNKHCYKIKGSSTALYRIGINESLKEETLLSFLENHKDLEHELLKGKNFFYRNFLQKCIAGRKPIYIKSLLKFSKNDYLRFNNESYEILKNHSFFKELCYQTYLFYKKIIKLLFCRKRIKI